MKPKHLSVAIQATTGMFIDTISKEGAMMDKLSRHFYRNHKQDYEVAAHNLSNKK